MKTNVHLWSPSILFRMREVLHKSCRENADTHLTVSTLISLSVHSSHCQYTHLTVSNIFPLKSSLLWYNVEKYCRAGQTINENTEHAHCMLDNQGYTHTHTEYVIRIAFHGNNIYTKTPRSCFIRTPPVLFIKQYSLPLFNLILQLQQSGATVIVSPQFVQTCNTYHSFCVCK